MSMFCLSRIKTFIMLANSSLHAYNFESSSNFAKLFTWSQDTPMSLFCSSRIKTFIISLCLSISFLILLPTIAKQLRNLSEQPEIRDPMKRVTLWNKDFLFFFFFLILYLLGFSSIMYFLFILFYFIFVVLFC